MEEVCVELGERGAAGSHRRQLAWVWLLTDARRVSHHLFDLTLLHSGAARTPRLLLRHWTTTAVCSEFVAPSCHLGHGEHPRNTSPCPVCVSCVWCLVKLVPIVHSESVDAAAQPRRWRAGCWLEPGLLHIGCFVGGKRQVVCFSSFGKGRERVKNAS